MKRFLCLCLVVAAACGENQASQMGDGQEGHAGEVVDVPAADVGWAVGWWRDPTENTTTEDGLFLFQVELREDGTATQQLSFCKTPDDSYEGRWEPVSANRVALFPADGDTSMPWIDAGSLERVELTVSEDASTVEVARISGDEGDPPSPAPALRSGRKCMTDIVVADCTLRDCESGE